MTPPDSDIARALGKIDADLEHLQEQLRATQEQIKSVNTKLDGQYITRVEFEATITPIRLLVFGVVGVVLTTVVGAALALIVGRG